MRQDADSSMDATSTANCGASGGARPAALRPRWAGRRGRATRPPTQPATPVIPPAARRKPRAGAGLLTDAEIEGLRAVYRRGAQGSVLIGLRHGERVMTLALPPRPTAEATIEALAASADGIRRLGADGFVHVRRARTRRSDRTPIEALLIHECMAAAERQRLAWLQAGDTRVVTLTRPINDAVARALRATITGTAL